MTHRDRDRIATWCGLAAPIVALGAVFLATLVAPPETFTWRDRALSDMGRYGAETFWLFNGGLILGGVLGVPFVWDLWTDGRNVLERLGLALLAVSLVGMIGVGAFFLDHTAVYLDRSLHYVAAVTFFGAAPFAHWLYGAGRVLAGDARVGLASLGTGIAHPVAWLGWLLARPAGDPGAWFAVPEMVAAIAFGGWILVLAGDRQRADSVGLSA